MKAKMKVFLRIEFYAKRGFLKGIKDAIAISNPILSRLGIFVEFKIV